MSLILIAWIAFAAYVQSHKKELLSSITTQLNENLNGTLTIEQLKKEGDPGGYPVEGQTDNQ